MNINSITIKNDGYVYCVSDFYQAIDILNVNQVYKFQTGINLLQGDIDSGNWAISYLLSMYPHFSSKTVLFEPLEASADGKLLTIKELSQYACYMDRKYPLFSTNKTVRQLITEALKQRNSLGTVEMIRRQFCLDESRFERPLSQTGNEIFRMMAAIGYSEGKQIFCFPWLSKMRFDSYRGHLTSALEILESFNKIVIVPVGV